MRITTHQMDFTTHEWAVIYTPTARWVGSLRPRVAGAHCLGTPQSVSIPPNSRTPSQLPLPHPISRSSSPTGPGAGMTQSFSHIQADISQRPGEEPRGRAHLNLPVGESHYDAASRGASARRGFHFRRPGGGSGGHGRRLLTDRETAVGAATSFLLLRGRQPSSLTLDGAGDREAARRGCLAVVEADIGCGDSFIILLINSHFHPRLPSRAKSFLCHIIFSPAISLGGCNCHHSHSTDEEVEAQRPISCPQSQGLYGRRNAGRSR